MSIPSIQVYKYDLIVVGSGIVGTIIAREFALKFPKKKVLILERRDVVSGNCFDYFDEFGLLIQKYGIHIFRSNETAAFEYIKPFSNWKYQDKFGSVDFEDGTKKVHSPFNYELIDIWYSELEGNELKQALEREFENSYVTYYDLKKSNNLLIQDFVQKMYEKDFEPYAIKQWGVSANTLDQTVLNRIPIALSYEIMAKEMKYHHIPENGFHSLFKNMLELENIDVVLETDALDFLQVKNNSIYWEDELIDKPIVWTGQVDQLLDYEFGQLEYRSLRFENSLENVDDFQGDVGVVYPAAKEYTRIAEWKHLGNQNPDSLKGKTKISYEFPERFDGKNEPYYPQFIESAQNAFEKYKNKLKDVKNLYLAGRLADYKYYNMDAAIYRALEVSKEIVMNCE